MICQIFIVTLCVVYVSSIVFYDRKKKNIVKTGYCRANGHGSSKITCHAEELAIKYCRENDIKTSTCCKSCTKLATKYNYQNRIFTFKDNDIINAIVDNPSVSLGNMLRNI